MFENTQRRLTELKEMRNLPLALEVVAGASDRKVPVDTGNLRSSRNIIIKDKEAFIEYTADYSLSVHENLDAHHNNGEAKFLEKGWAEKKDDFFRILFGR